MAFDMSNPLGFFFANGPQSQSYEAVAARRKIAEAMMARQTKAPKSVGEGLSAIGEAIGDRGYYNNVLADEQANRGYEAGKVGAPAPPPSSYAPYSPTPAPAPLTAPPPRTTGELTTDPAGETAVMPPPAPVADAAPPDGNTTPARFASVRYNNPGAAYPGQDATAFGSTGTGIIGGGHKIAQFPTPVHGAAANMALLERGYTGMPIGAAISKWSGGSRNTVPGFDPSTVITKDMLRDPNTAIPLMQAIAGGEAPGRYPMSPEQWKTAHQWYTQGRPGAAPGPRDQIAAAMTPPAGPMTPQDTQQEATMSDVIGMQKAPTAGYAFPPTASARTGDVQSDASPLGIRPTGGLGGDSPVASSVADTVQTRGDAIKGPIPITPEPNPPPPVGQIQTADATAPRPPGVTADATTAAPVTPQGPPQIAPLGPKPEQPKLQPTENERTRHYEAIASDDRLSLAARQNAKSIADAERAQVNSFNAQKIQEYNFYLQKWLDAKSKREDPGTQLDVYKKQMELTPDQINDLTPQEKAVLGDLPPGVRVYKDALGHLQKIVGPQTVTVDQRGEGAEATMAGQLAAKRGDETIKAAEAADETKFNIARARAMLDQIKTGKFEEGRMNIAAMGRGLGLSDEFLVGIGLDPKSIGTKQAFKAIVNELAMGKIGAGGMPSNNFSEGDRKFLNETVISLGDDDESNRIKLGAAELVADRKREKANAWGDWQDDPNNKGGYGAFERKWNREMRARTDSVQLQKDADAWLAKTRGQLPSPPLEFSPQEKADAIKWIGLNKDSPKIPAIKQRYGLP